MLNYSEGMKSDTEEGEVVIFPKTIMQIHFLRVVRL